MSQYSDKEIQLIAAVIKASEGLLSTSPSIDWKQVALDSGYKDHANAKIMWRRLEKKLIEAAAHAAGNDNDDAGENPTATPATASKKRKATGNKAGRPAKKSKGTAADVNTNGSSTKVEASIEQEDEEEAT